LEDLAALGTLGFRGEALPSIGAVSRLTLTSRGPGSDEAWTVAMQGSADIDGPRPAAHAAGTTIEVRDLFFSTPVRRRFLKSDRTEFLHIHDWLRRTALASPRIGLSLTHNQQRVLAMRPALSEEQIVRRLEKVCGAAFTRHARPVSAAVPGLSVHGWIAAPAGTRNQSDLQFWFVNGRPVRDPRLQHATRLAYDDALAPGRHPAYALYLEIDPEALDVNVHPAKIEVRFADARRVHDFVFSALRRVLHAPEPAPARALPAGGRDAGGAARPAVAEPASMYAARAARAPAGAVTCQDAGGTDAPSTLAAGMAMALAGGLIVVRTATGLLLVDAQEARATLWIDAMQRGGDGRAVVVQPLLFPCSRAVGVEAAGAIERTADLLATCGVEIERVAPGSVMLRGVPAALQEVPVQALLEGVMRSCAGAGGDDEYRRAAIIDGIARAGAAALAPLTDVEATSLLRELEGRFDDDVLLRRRIARRLSSADLRRLLEAGA
jgi:DNA mismatch repair protein MutL